MKANNLLDYLAVHTNGSDDPDRVPPRDHTHVTSRPAWVELGDRIPAYPGARS